MARCRCSEELCVCMLTGGENITVTGAGSPANPWIVSAPLPNLECFDCTLPGNVGDVLVLQADGSYAPMPVGVNPGIIVTEGGLIGDGTLANPLRPDICTYGELKAMCVP